ncbi:Sucrose phosphorylase [Gimesia panareensis]|uniref:Sucrose phosphorylase n=1 Tax=Gimesia panareensis TaxID=2527978 RepID=A0A518FMT8_9PLAN|nr:sugar phosphorylase [Gimesia panareensis]QDV17671.1 Sucrose phosphorylase [Gimesia panareensis]
MTEPVEHTAISEYRFMVENHLKVIYPDLDHAAFAQDLIDIMCPDGQCQTPETHQNHWDQKNVVMITYGDSLLRKGEHPLETLLHFSEEYLSNTINGIHILPFFPYSSDDGFSVIDYHEVNHQLGDWDDVNAIADKFQLMSDLVINHCSSQSEWFEQFKRGEFPGTDFFFCASPDDDLSEVVRPRTNELLQRIDTPQGPRYVWCTFSHDQIDLNFAEPLLLKEVVKIVRLYLNHGVQIFRLDAVAFIWKVPGTSCLSLPETHEIVRLLRTLIQFVAPQAMILTETNIPNRENLAYFGNSNEAHAIYNFSLPPLLVNALLCGSCQHLKTWMMSMPPALHGTTYLNFIASHDGIGLRPAEGLMDEDEISQMVAMMEQFGGRISMRSLAGGGMRPYEINISLFDAMQGTLDGEDEWQIPRFLCAHAIMIALEGIPAIYIHSFLGTHNDQEAVERTGHNRSINRHRWDYDQLQAVLADDEFSHAHVFKGLCHLLQVRRRQPAFHPNATQFTLHLGDAVFAFWRQSMDRQQSIFALNNVSDEQQIVPLSEINLIGTDSWIDLISGEIYSDLRAELVLQPYQVVWLTNLFDRE